MPCLAFVKPFRLVDLLSPIANDVSVPESGPLDRTSSVIRAVIAAMSVATIIGYLPRAVPAGCRNCRSR